MYVQYYMKSGIVHIGKIDDGHSVSYREKELSEKIVDLARIPVTTDGGTIFLDTDDIERIRVVD